MPEKNEEHDRILKQAAAIQQLRAAEADVARNEAALEAARKTLATRQKAVADAGKASPAK